MILLGVFRRFLMMVGVVTVAVLGFVFRDELASAWRFAAARWDVLRGQPAAGAEPAATSPELANLAQSRIDDIRTGRLTRASFTGAELQSLLQYRYRQVLPAFVDSPRIALEGDRIRLKLRLPVEHLPNVEELGDVAAFLPDTTDLDIRGQLLPAEDGAIAFAVDAVSAERIPLPKRLVPAALTMLGRRDRPGLPADAIELPLPKGLRAAYVRADSLVLLAGTEARTQD